MSGDGDVFPLHQGGLASGDIDRFHLGVGDVALILQLPQVVPARNRQVLDVNIPGIVGGVLPDGGVGAVIQQEGHALDDEAELMGILDACELSYFEPETARVFENAIERLFYSDSFRIGGAVLPQSRVRSRLHLLDGMILRNAESKLHANLDRPIRNSTAYTMATIFNCIAESESDLMVDPYLNSLRSPPGRR